MNKTLLTMGLLCLLATEGLAQTTPIEKAEQELKARPTLVRVLASPADAEISLGGKVLGKGTAEVRLAPGSHEVKISHPEHRAHIETLALTPGAPDIILRVHLKPALAPAPAQTWSPGMVDDLGSARPVVGWISLGVGVGMLAGAALLATNSQIDSRCSQDTPTFCADAQEYAGLAAITGGIGGALGLAGIGLLIWDVLAATPQTQDGEAPMALSPRVTPDHVGLQLWWTF